MQIEVLSYAAPPLLGAFIGYLTNKVAIRMLFRPLKPWSVLGVRVPMTPGVIPSKRHELALNMGEMVGEHLLTSKDIGAALSEERFQDHLYHLVDKRVHDLLHKDLGSVLTLVPKRFRGYAKIGIRTIKQQLQQGIHVYIQSDSFAETFKTTLEEQLGNLGDKELESFLSSQSRESIYKLADKLIKRLFTDPRAAERLAGFLEQFLAREAAKGKTLAELLPQDFVDSIARILEQQTPQLLEQLAVMLAEPAVRAKIIQAIKDGVDNFLDTLGPMGAMARGFVNMDTIDATIRTYLEEKEDDFNAWLQGDEVVERVEVMLSTQVRVFFETPLAEFLYYQGEGNVHTMCAQAAEGGLSLLSSKEVLLPLCSYLRTKCEAALEQGNIRLADLGQALFDVEGQEHIMQTLSCEVVSMLRSEQAGRMVDRLLNSMIDQVVVKPVGVLHNLMPDGVRRGITEYIVGSANQMLLKEVPGLVDSLNIREIVTAKVDSLDLLRLEGLLLSIMEEQFKYINIFGGLLGFLIGLINLLVLSL
jgi:uncharacterized membrane protein YheB (UPF0754 family)